MRSKKTVYTVAKVGAVALQVPLSFLGHRYLTFGSGIRAALNRFFAAQRAG